jgi:hypothetical protein
MWWLVPVIPAIWEAEIGRIKDRGQKRQKKKKLTHPISKNKGVARNACNPSYKGGIVRRTVIGGWPYLKHN